MNQYVSSIYFSLHLLLAQARNEVFKWPRRDSQEVGPLTKRNKSESKSAVRTSTPAVRTNLGQIDIACPPMVPYVNWAKEQYQCECLLKLPYRQPRDKIDLAEETLNLALKDKLELFLNEPARDKILSLVWVRLALETTLIPYVS
jgi:hypothetical protein